MKVLLALQMILELPKRLRTIALGYEFYFSLHKTFSFVANCSDQPHYYQPCHRLQIKESWSYIWLQIKKSGSYIWKNPLTLPGPYLCYERKN